MQLGLLGALLSSSDVLWPIVLAAAVWLLDMLFPDPAALPHPVQAIGRLLNAVETTLRRAVFAKSRKGLRFAGGIGAFFCLAIAGFIVCFLTSLPLIGVPIAAYLAWAGLALGGLRKAGKSALFSIAYGSIDEARAAVSFLVSRDTKAMERDELRRSLAETLAENFNDGFVAPFFWLILAGPVGLWIYKAVSTMDSMWGYKTPRWLDFGCAAARLDDALAFIPARLSALFLCIGGRFTKGCTSGLSWNLLAKDADRTVSPNAGWPMAACAWLCSARMGGPTPYHGTLIDKPLLGPAGAWSNERIQLLLRLLGAGGAACAVILSFTAWLLLIIF